MSMKNSNDTIGNRTGAFPQCLNQLRHRVPPNQSYKGVQYFSGESNKN
jgi:hypothetical protein